jgi:lipopolysaccharide transport system ATP-binding protein
MTKKEITSKIDEIIDFSGCERYIDTPVKRYSSGMTVRLAFAVAAFLEPEILIIDEVLAVGDAEFQKKAIGKMQDISKGEGRTVLFVSHNMAAMKSLCTRGIVLENGGVVFDGGTIEAIDLYMNSDQIFESIWNRITPVNSIAYFTHASIVNSENKYVQVVSNNKHCFIKLKVIVVAKVFDGTFAFEIVNQLDQSIFVSHDFDLTDSIREAGCFEILIPIPKFLRAGNYFVNLGSNIRGFTTLEYLPNVLGFEYIDELYGGQTQSRPGTVFIPLKWEINKI